jgi:hypothetical protein
MKTVLSVLPVLSLPLTENQLEIIELGLIKLYADYPNNGEKRMEIQIILNMINDYLR